MPDAFTSHYLDDAVRQFRQLKALAEKAMAQIGNADFFVVLDEEANSIAMLLKHMAGSMQARWKDFLTVTNERPERRRDDEFIRVRLLFIDMPPVDLPGLKGDKRCQDRLLDGKF